MSALLICWAACVVVVTLRALSPRRPLPAPGPADGRAVVLLRPCAGAEPGLYRRLCSGRADVVRFVVASEADTARPPAERAAARLRLRGVDAGVLVRETDAPNRKADVLAAMVRAWPDALLVNADSDVDLEGVDLDRLVRPLRGDGTLAALWVPPVETGPVATLGDRVSRAFLNGSLHAFPVLGTLDPHGLVGKLFALRTDRATAAGGLEPLRHVLGEDVELSARLRKAGFDVRPAPHVARARASGRSLRAVVGRYARWLAVVRGQRPALLLTYPLLFGATPALVLGGAWLGGPVGLGVAATALLARLSTAYVARRRAGDPGSIVVDVVLADLLVWCALVGALFTREVRWRDRRLRWRRGRLEVVEGAG